MKRSRVKARTSLRSSVLSQNVEGLNKTIQLDSSDETDIIECSVDENGDKYDFLRTPRSNLKRSFVTESRNDVISLEEAQVKRDKTPAKNNSSLRPSLKTLDDVSIISGSSIAAQTNYKTPKRKQIEVQPVTQKLISTVKKTPNVPFLSKSKLQNIEKWLTQNDIETVRTPPFANLSVTPTPGKAAAAAPPPKTPKTERKRTASDSSVDSEVGEVLRAVYGEDWKSKNVLKKCRTEPKRRPNVLPGGTKTEVKAKRGRPAKNLLATPKPVRRNILGKETPKVHDDSVDLGIEEINLDQSDDFAIAKNFSAVKRKKRKEDEDEDDGDGYSISSWKPSSKKKKLESPLRTRSGRTRSPGKTPKKTFLASLSVSTPSGRCHPEAQYFKLNFKTKKDELAKKLYKLYNSEVFEDKLPADMSLTWNVKLRGTAGFCYNKRITKSTGEVIRSSRVEFSTKVVDRADRLRDTLIHELCHAATWVIDGVLDGHGDVWKKWAKKAVARFPELPPVNRCHNYDILSKYTYKCTGCGYAINRHSKSIDTERKRCGYCYGVLELLVNKKRRGKAEVPEYDTTRTLRTPNHFALFVKENYHSVKSTKANAKHAEIMKVLSQQYAIVKKNAGTPQPLPTTTQ